MMTASGWPLIRISRGSSTASSSLACCVDPDDQRIIEYCLICSFISFSSRRTSSKYKQRHALSRDFLNMGCRSLAARCSELAEIRGGLFSVLMSSFPKKERDLHKVAFFLRLARRANGVVRWFAPPRLTLLRGGELRVLGDYAWVVAPSEWRRRSRNISSVRLRLLFSSSVFSFRAAARLR